MNWKKFTEEKPPIRKMLLFKRTSIITDYTSLGMKETQIKKWGFVKFFRPHDEYPKKYQPDYYEYKLYMYDDNACALYELDRQAIEDEHEIEWLNIE